MSIWRYTHHTYIVGNRSNGAGHMRAVIVVIVGVAIVVNKVPAVKIIDITVAIVVKAVAGDFTRVGPNVGGQVGVI